MILNNLIFPLRQKFLSTSGLKIKKKKKALKYGIFVVMKKMHRNLFGCIYLHLIKRPTFNLKLAMLFLLFWDVEYD